MFGPGAYRPDPTEGLSAIADLPPPEIVPASCTYTRQACPRCGYQAYRGKQYQWRDHRVFVPFATMQNWVEAGEKKAQARLDPDFLDWALADFSGYVAADEVYDGPFCILSAVDNRRYKRILYDVLGHDPTHEDIRAFLRRLKTALTARALALSAVSPPMARRSILNPSGRCSGRCGIKSVRFIRRCRAQTALDKLATLRRRLRRFPQVGATLKKLFSPTLEKALTFLDDKLLPATSNAVEQGDRRYREMQKSVYRPRGGPPSPRPS